MWLVSLLLGVARAIPLVEVQGPADCPSASAIRSAMAALVDDDHPAAARARLQATGGRLEIQLQRLDGTPLGERTLELAGSCDQLAETVALVIVVWERDLRQGQVPELGRPLAAARAPVPTRAARSVLEVGGGLSGLIGRDTRAPAALVEASLFPRAGAWAASVSLSALAAHAVLGPGSISWQRLSLAAGPRRRAHLGPWALDLTAQLAAALIEVRGRGFSETFSDRGFDPGLVAGARLSRGRRTFFWLGLDGAGHLHDRVARVEGMDISWRFPRFDAQLSVGLGYRSGR
jgi:hypothetical protein